MIVRYELAQTFSLYICLCFYLQRHNAVFIVLKEEVNFLRTVGSCIIIRFVFENQLLKDILLGKRSFKLREDAVAIHYSGSLEVLHGS